MLTIRDTLIQLKQMQLHNWVQQFKLSNNELPYVFTPYGSRCKMVHNSDGSHLFYLAKGSSSVQLVFTHIKSTDDSRPADFLLFIQASSVKSM